MALKRNSRIKASDLVCKHVYDKYGEYASLEFIDPYLMEVLKKLKDKYLPNYIIVINDWNSEYPTFSNNGLICNMCLKSKLASMVNTPFINMHALGRAVDIMVYDYREELLPTEKVMEILENQVTSDKVNALKFLVYKPESDPHIHIDTSPNSDGGIWGCDDKEVYEINNVTFIK